MIFSLLKIRKKTAATISSIAIALASLWGLAMWQNISREEILSLLWSTLLMLGVIVVCAILLITIFKLLSRLLQKIMSRDHDDQ
ncbi:MAG: hypothetical protein EXR84_00995 [Gammaproteobacteria bacterium]|nr:hypothetical protein [Gammaproteobacteria bacterium]